jgi:hypothetical protein
LHSILASGLQTTASLHKWRAAARVQDIMTVMPPTLTRLGVEERQRDAHKCCQRRGKGASVRRGKITGDQPAFIPQALYMMETCFSCSQSKCCKFTAGHLETTKRHKERLLRTLPAGATAVILCAQGTSHGLRYSGPGEHATLLPQPQSPRECASHRWLSPRLPTSNVL